jgi:hypothetical protein
MDKIESKSGQALLEYVLLLAIVVGLYGAVLNQLTQSSVMTTLKKPFTTDYKYTYQYGHKDARGQEGGGPIDIPQQHDAQYFRIFINPPISK